MDRKHIVCFGDSNTHGYCADPADCAAKVAQYAAWAESLKR